MLKRYKHGSFVNILGVKYILSFEKTKTLIPRIIVTKTKVKVYTNDPRINPYNTILTNWLREVAGKYIKNKTTNLAGKYGFEYKDLRIKSVKTRWGSCSSKRNLNFNWKLVFAPKKCVDYVIIHELAHTKQMNHSYKFWDLVEDCMPDYKVHMKQLKIIERSIILD